MSTSFLRLSWLDLFKMALDVKRARGDTFEFCSIINAKSGLCDGACAFCAQAFPERTKAPVYPLVDPEVVLDGAKKAKENRAKRYSIVTSGKRINDKGFGKILDAVRLVLRKVKIEVDVSLGIIPRDYLVELKKAGVKRVHHNLETSERFYPRITTRIKWEDKFKFAQMVKEEGLELCCGALLGMGEDEEDWRLLADALYELQPESVPINFLIPIKGTPLESANYLTPTRCLKAVSYFRVRLPDSEIRLCGGREHNLRELQSLAALVVDGFMVGGYLTRPGRDPQLDLQLVEDLGLKLN